MASGLFFSADKTAAARQTGFMFDLGFDGDAAVLTLDRPSVRNAIPLDGWDALRARIDEVRAAGPRLLVLRGAGGAFCAGADIDEFASLRDDEAARSRFRIAMRRALDALARLPMPAIAAIEGACYGAGVALALACDIRLAGVDARFAITPARMGISFPQQDVRRLVALVGPARASLLLFTAGTIDSAEAIRIGLADGAVADLDSIRAAILANDGTSISGLKRGIALAAGGIASDEQQDRGFDDSFGSQRLAEALAVRRARS